ncbi:AAA family ATPase [Flavobacterium zhairuonense]|uniref:AAA family ATPase n=1 Tax=Flavobacterium zhairuonense TaxID=2493631 RepID=UPI00104BD4AE|nr:AAA family ATPase [Flavobacterium zhairuonense]KAF2508410.1 AAA family ATPase [Flavobacterium zhairuonense]
MRISKIHVKEEITKTKNLEEINLIRKSLGPTVALVGKNGAGKSRILHFVESYIQTISPIDFLKDHILHLPQSITRGQEKNLINAKSALKLINNNISDQQNQAYLIQAQNFIGPIYQNLQRLGKGFVKFVDNDDLKNIKLSVNNAKSLSFEQILNNEHLKSNLPPNNNQNSLLNEFTALNTQSTIEYFTKLTHEIIGEEFNLYIKNRDNPQVIIDEIKKQKAFQLFSLFQDYVKKFLGKEFSYQQTAQGNTLNSILHYNNLPFNLDQFSPGQKTLFAYAILFFYLDVNSQTNIRDSIIIIDEPEKHLHPEAQITLINALKSIISKSGQLWIATHSVHILSHLEYDEIMMVKDNKIIPPSRTTPGKSFNDLMGLDNHIDELICFINSISEWAYGNFMTQCFKEPDVIFGNDPNDPQFKLFKEFIAQKTKINLLDFGAGKGRIGYTLNEDEVVSEKTIYSAFEPDKGNYEMLNNVPNIEKIYSLPTEIPDNYFDCVLLCNVLHEIHPQEWEDSLKTAKRVLKDDGYLLIVEDRYLPKGENAHQFGYLILGAEETQILLNTDVVLELKLEEEEFKERILFNAFKKDDINPDKDSIVNSIKKLKENSFYNLKLLRKTTQDANQGRRYANETQLYINSQLALEVLNL